MLGQKNWLGIECEGRYAGLKTMFVRAEYETPPEDYSHIYFTREFLIDKENVLFLEKFILDTTKCVTIECNNETYKYLTPNMKVRAHIIYRIEDTNVNKLKHTDEVMIDCGVYNVLCFTKLTGMQVSYADYANDTLLKKG